MVALIHQQRMPIWRKRRGVRGGWPWRTRGNPIRLKEREVDRFGAILIHSVAVDFKAVDVQRRAPMREIAAELGDERRKAGWIELQLHKRRACKKGRVLVAIGDARPIGKGVGVAERHGEPDRREQLESLLRRQWPIARQREVPLHIVAGMRNRRNKANVVKSKNLPDLD